MKKFDGTHLGGVIETALLGTPKIAPQGMKLITEFVRKFGERRINKESGREYIFISKKHSSECATLVASLIDAGMYDQSQSRFMKELRDALNQYVNDHSDNADIDALQDRSWRFFSAIKTPFDLVGVDAFVDFFDTDTKTHHIVGIDVTARGEKLKEWIAPQGVVLFDASIDSVADPQAYANELKRLAAAIVEKAVNGTGFVVSPLGSDTPAVLTK